MKNKTQFLWQSTKVSNTIKGLQNSIKYLAMPSPQTPENGLVLSQHLTAIFISAQGNDTWKPYRPSVTYHNVNITNPRCHSPRCTVAFNGKMIYSLTKLARYIANLTPNYEHIWPVFFCDALGNFCMRCLIGEWFRTCTTPTGLGALLNHPCYFRNALFAVGCNSVALIGMFPFNGGLFDCVC